VSTSTLARVTAPDIKPIPKASASRRTAACCGVHSLAERGRADRRSPAPSGAHTAGIAALLAIRQALLLVCWRCEDRRFGQRTSRVKVLESRRFPARAHPYGGCIREGGCVQWRGDRGGPRTRGLPGVDACSRYLPSSACPRSTLAVSPHWPIGPERFCYSFVEQTESVWARNRGGKPTARARRSLFALCGAARQEALTPLPRVAAQ